jgi:hypothetical protein
MSDRPIVGRVIPVQGPDYVPDHVRRASSSRWTVAVRRRGRTLTVTLTAPSAGDAARAERDLAAAALAYTRQRRDA